jgi:hypothetical protein
MEKSIYRICKKTLLYLADQWMRVSLITFFCLYGGAVSLYAQNLKGLTLAPVSEHTGETIGTVVKRCGCAGDKTIYMIEGIPISIDATSGSFTTVNPQQIDSIKINKQFMPDLGVIEIFMKPDISTGMRHIRLITHNYTRTHPWCKIVLDGEAADNPEIWIKLFKLDKQNIKRVKLNRSRQIIEIRTKKRKQ